MGLFDALKETVGNIKDFCDEIIAEAEADPWGSYPDSTIEDEWNSRIKYIPIDDPQKDLYTNPDNRYYRLLDEEYGKRFPGKKTWKQLKEEGIKLKEPTLKDIFKEAATDTLVNAKISRWKSMEIFELEGEWEGYVSTIPFDDPERDIYETDKYPDLKALDQVYGRRTNKKTWRELKYEDKVKKERAEKEKEEKKKREEQKKEAQRIQAEKTREENKKRTEKKNTFKEKLEHNSMVEDIIHIIDGLEYDACYVEVREDSVVCSDEDDEELKTIRFKKYGYPSLDEDQMEVLLQYLQSHLKLNYEENDDEYYLELCDAPGGMKDSW